MVDVGKGCGTVADTHVPATASRALSVWAREPANPSPTTIAPPRWRLPAGAMFAIVGGRLNTDDTQHRPELVARTGAPCHTRTALPGAPTSGRWKVVPVRRHEHEDENGIAMATSCVTDGASGMTQV